MLRLLAIAVLMLAIAPGTWVRTEVDYSVGFPIAVSKIAGAADTEAPGWRREGIWQYESDALMFGGFSAMLTLKDNWLRAFSDRGMRFTLREPDQPQKSGAKGKPARKVVRQLVAPGRAKELWDIESATRDPQTKKYWLGFENMHAIHRFTVASEVDGVRIIDKEVDWASNSGAEAMVRLADGRFLIVPESGRELLIYASDPISGVAGETYGFRNPMPGFAVVDMKQMPDGRLLLLMRSLTFDIPPFASLLAIGDPPAESQEEPISPEVVLDLTDVLPRENYEGLALRPRADGALDVWIMSDENLVAFQRTLLAKLVFDPRVAAQDAEESAEADRAKQKARE